MSNVINLHGVNMPEVNTANTFGTEYAQNKLPEVLGLLENCGLASEYLAIMGRHVQDLVLVLEDPGRADSSALTVGASIEDNGEKTWHRAAILSRADLSQKKTALEEQVVRLELDVPEIDSELNRVALNWGFYELMSDALGNSVSMQRRYNKYIPDWNGQAVCYLGQYAVSETIFEEYAQTKDNLSDQEYVHLQRDIRYDYRNLRAGIALELLRDNLLLHVTGKVTHANWLIRGLRTDYYQKRSGIEPLSKHEIMARLSMLQPRTPLMMNEFIDQYFDDPDDQAKD